MPRLLNKLTDTALRSARGRDRPYKMFDGGGMYLLVNPDGSRYWRLKYRFNGKEKLLSLGVYPDDTLALARDRRKKYRELLSDKVDPGQAKKKEKREALLSATNSFEAVAREWHGKQKQWTSYHSKQVIKSLEANVFPALGSQPIKDISPADVLDALRPIEARGALEIAQRVLQRCSAVFRYGIATSRLRNNPAADLKGALQSPPKNHYPHLKADELPEFLDRLQKYDGEKKTQLAIKLLMLTFVRTGELRAAKWSEFNLEEKLWRIPAERMKMGVEHLVPISRQALVVLAELQEITGNYDLLLPGRSNIRKPISENTILYGIYRMGYRGRMTGHGFRSVASTYLNEEGFDSDAIERQLAHGEKNKVRAAYNKAKYLDERKEMMQAWADFIDAY